MKNLLTKLAVALMCTTMLLSCSKKSETKGYESKIIASTSWTAAFCYLAGVDDVTTVAPASLRHPPEYELTVQDIQNIQSSKYFVYAGFERMMKTLGEALGEDSDVQLVKIACTNDIETVRSQTKMLAETFGTTSKWEKRIAQYEKTIADGKDKLAAKGLGGAKVYCNKNQIYLAKDLGLEVSDTFGPGAVTSGDIALAKDGDFAFIIDNVHNPVGGPLQEVSNASYIIWRNFPDNTEPDSLRKMIAENIEAILK